MNKGDFNGFTPQTIQFFKDLEGNNNKEWFDENRSIYEKEVREPFKALAISLAPAMCAIDPDFEIRPHRIISRINRDIRFSKNKDPYKTCMWMFFERAVKSEKCMNYPGYFMELSAEGYILGMGYAGANRVVMDDVRDNITFRAEEFKKETEKLLKKGFNIGGDMYKRQIANDLPEYYQQWMQRKTVWVNKKESIGQEVFSIEFAQKLISEFQSLEWLYHFFKESQPE